MKEKRKPDEELADFLASCYADPLKYVMGCFPWTTEPSIQLVELPKKYRRRFDSLYGPDLWACEFLDELGAEIRKRKFDGIHAVDPILCSTSSGHGIGKSVLVAWLIKFIADTRPYSRGIVTATTAEQLKTKTWAELGKWHRLSLTAEWFKYNAGRGSMMLTHNTYPEQWRCDAQTCREENAEAFQGLHAANSTAYFIFDEASGVPDKIFDAREGGSTDGEPMVFDFGNPTRNSGRFFENTVGRFKHRYKTRQIDSRTVAITNKQRIDQWISDYGVESDFVKVRVRGVFPASGDWQFISSAEVEEAMRRPLTEDKYAPLVIGVDVARQGSNESVIYIRRGRDARSFPPRRYMGLDTVQLTGKVIEVIREFRQLGLNYAGLFVDGTGIGGGVVDQLHHLGYPVYEVHFGNKAIDYKTYKARGDEIWGAVRDSLKAGLCLPPLTTQEGPILQRQLTQREYGYTGSNQIKLESKDDMELRGVESPDIADSLALTYAQEVAPVKTVPGMANQAKQAEAEYNPLEAKW